MSKASSEKLCKLLTEVQDEARAQGVDLMISFDETKEGYEVELKGVFDQKSKVILACHNIFIKEGYDWAIKEWLESGVERLIHVRENGLRGQL